MARFLNTGCFKGDIPRSSVLCGTGMGPSVNTHSADRTINDPSTYKSISTLNKVIIPGTSKPIKSPPRLPAAVIHLTNRLKLRTSKTSETVFQEITLTRIDKAASQRERAKGKPGILKSNNVFDRKMVIARNINIEELIRLEPLDVIGLIIKVDIRIVII